MTIPVFYQRDLLGRELIKAELRSRNWRAAQGALPTRDDVIYLLVMLEEICQFHSDTTRELELDYAVIRKVSRDTRLPNAFLRDMLSPVTFMKLPKSATGKVTVVNLLTVITRSISLANLHASLSCVASGVTSEVITSVDALEDWLYHQSHRLVQIQKMTEQFLPLWVFTAAHTISFFHGHQKASAFGSSVPGSNRTSTISVSVNVKDLVLSPTMRHILELSRLIVEDFDNNPFSRIRAVRYYDSFTVFDAGRNPEIPSFEQCSIYAGGYMNPVFMDRLLTAYGGPPLDYRRFLAFAIAWDNRRTIQGVKYFWPILDKDKKGYINEKNVMELIQGILQLLQCLPAGCGPQGPRAAQVLLDEIKDLFRTHILPSAQRPPDCVLTRQEAIDSPDALGAVIGILGNSQTFIEYECREDTAHKHFVAKQVKEARLARSKAALATRAGQLAVLQQLVDECWFNVPVRPKYNSFAEFLDYHEATYGGESMEPWLAKYYQWEQQEAEHCQMLLSESQFAVSEADSVSVIQRGDEEHSVAEPSELVEPRE